MVASKRRAMLLEGTISLIQDPSSWCKMHEALTPSGKNTYASDKEATQWCLTGAMIRAGHDINDNLEDKSEWIEWSDMVGLQRELAFIVDNEWGSQYLDPERCLANFNDRATTGHGDVMMLLRRVVR